VSSSTRPARNERVAHGNRCTLRRSWPTIPQVFISGEFVVRSPPSKHAVLPASQQP